MSAPRFLQQCRDRFRSLTAEYDWDNDTVIVSAKILSPEEAIGRPQRMDYPILQGVERVTEATVRDARGQVFTDAPCDFRGRFRNVMELPLTTHHNRTLFLATMNAALCHMGLIDGTVHCKDDAPEQCGADVARTMRARGAKSVGLIGLNPGLASALVRVFGPTHVRITDLNPKNVGQQRFNVIIEDGQTHTADLIQASDLILATGTTMVNGTFDEILELTRQHDKPLIVFGITAAGACHLMNIERWCPLAQPGR